MQVSRSFLSQTLFPFFSAVRFSEFPAKWRRTLGLAGILPSLALIACSPSSGSPASSAAAPSPGTHSAAILDFLPPAVTTNASADRTTLQQVQARAKAENKKIILEMKAAWCGPCNQVAYQIDQHPQILQDLAKAGYILVKAEYEKLAVPEFANDFLPIGIHYFPSFFTYSEGTGWTEFAVNVDSSTVLDLVGAVQAHQPTAAEVLSALQALQAAKGALSDNSDNANTVWNGLYVSFTNYSYADMVSAFGALNKLHVPGSTLMTDDDWSTIDFVENGAVVDAMLAEGKSLSQVQKDFPNVATNILTPSADDGINPIAQGPLFVGALKNLVRQQGLAAASAQCDSIWASARAQLLPGSQSASDFSASLAALDPLAHSHCLTLKAMALGSQASTLNATVNSLLGGTPDVGRLHEFWGTLAAVGLQNLAAQNYDARVSASLANMNNELGSLKTQLQNAQNSGNQASAQKLQESINETQFQIQYQTQVGQDVDTGLKNNKPISVLEILN